MHPLSGQSMKRTIQNTKNAAEQLIIAVANSLKESTETGDRKAYRTMQKILLPLGEFAVEVDKIYDRVNPPNTEASGPGPGR